MNTQEKQVSVSDEAKKAALSRRLENFGWGVLLIAIGTIWLVPERLVPPGALLIAIGLIMLGLNAVRYFTGIAMHCFSLVIGVFALAAGAGEFFGLKVSLFAIALIVIGVAILLRPLVEKESHWHAGRGWSCCGAGEQDGHAPRQGMGRC